jgi:hypothetical protein
MTLLSFDLNSTRVRAVGGPAGTFPLTVPLEPPHPECPLVLSWTGRSFDVGSKGLLLCREQPFLVCRDFLPHLGERNPAALRLQAGQHQLDGYQALKLVFQELRPLACNRHGVAFAFPPYLKLSQVHLVSQLVEQLHYPLLGSLGNPLALALAGFAEYGWSGSAVVVDVDDHALWLGLVTEADGLACLRQNWVLPRLGLRHWKNRLLNALADCFITISRRDPRASASAEQSLFLQLDGIMDQSVHNRPSHVACQAAGWYQEVVLQPGAVADYCQPLVRHVVAELGPLFNSSQGLTPPSAVLLSHQAAALPGLAASLQQFIERWSLFHRRERPPAPVSDPEDFGENLLQEEDDEGGTRLIVLPVDATARGAHSVAAMFYHGVLPEGHLEEAAPLPERQPLESGPARLHYQGRDYFLCDHPFTIGRAHDCDMILDAHRFPEIAPRHCAVMYDLRRYLLRSLAREAATWVNQQPVEQFAALSPGDWIHLGRNGPRLQFLGQPDLHAMTTTA